MALSIAIHTVRAALLEESSSFNPSRVAPYEMKDNWGMQMQHDMDAHLEEEGPMKGRTEMTGMNIFSEYNYDYLEAVEHTDFDSNRPVKKVLLNLTGNMGRYIWSMNGRPLSEADNIEIEKGEVVQITLNNLTMMHHPMHLHGHFFRVINKNGARSPLKHTINMPPMQSVKIEFDANEYGGWFFHCRILYHMGALVH